MAGFKKGEIVVLEDQREFICFKKVPDGDKTYLLMLSNFKPVEMFFAEEIVQDGQVCLRKVGDPEVKKRLAPIMGLYQQPAESPAPAPAEPEPPRTPAGDVSDEPLGVGETIELENMGSYVCYRTINLDGKEYLCLMSTHKPRELLFGLETVVNGVLSVSIVKDAATHNRLAQVIKKKPLGHLKQMFARKSKKK